MMSRTYPWSLEDLKPATRQVVALVAKGMDDEEIGERLHIHPKTASRHITLACDRWGVDAYAMATRRINLALRFLLVEGHLERLDWPVPTLD